MKLLGIRLRALLIGPAPDLSRPTFETNEGLRFRQLAARKKAEREQKHIDKFYAVVSNETAP